MDPSNKLLPSQGEPLLDQRGIDLNNKQNYFIATCLDISFAVSVVSQFLQSPLLGSLECFNSHFEIQQRSTRKRPLI